MKRLILAALILTVSLGGCSVMTGGTAASAAPGVSIAAEKSLTIAHLAYNGIGESLIVAAKSGALHGPAATKAKVFYDKAGDALIVADKADAAANEAGVLDAISAATDAIAAANALVKGN